MSICKTLVKELATKLALSPINRTPTATPKSRLTRRSECQRLTPFKLYQRSPQTPSKCSSPKQESLCSVLPKQVLCTLQPVVPSIGNNVNYTVIQNNCSPRSVHPSKSPISPISPTSARLEGPEMDSPLREDLLHRPQIKRDMTILGRGAFGHVFFGRWKERRVAVKISRQQISNSVGEWNCVHLDHPHIIRILAIQEKATYRLTLMEYAGSKNLQQILADHQTEIPITIKFRYSWQIASAVDYCHQQNILHLDIKPANIVVSSTGCCKLGDFGCSQMLTQAGETLEQVFTLQGTVAYIAPEVLRGQTPTISADIYSLGVVFWQLLTRKSPFEGEDHHAVIYKVVSVHHRPPVPSTNDCKLQPYVRLMQQCWDPCKNKRPALPEILDQLSVHF